MSNGSFGWIVSEAITPGTDYTIRITSVNDANLFDVSDTSFTIFSVMIFL